MLVCYFLIIEGLFCIVKLIFVIYIYILLFREKEKFLIIIIENKEENKFDLLWNLVMELE